MAGFHRVVRLYRAVLALSIQLTVVSMVMSQVGATTMNP